MDKLISKLISEISTVYIINSHFLIHKWSRIRREINYNLPNRAVSLSFDNGSSRLLYGIECWRPSLAHLSDIIPLLPSALPREVMGSYL